MKKLLLLLFLAPLLSATTLAQTGCQAYFYADSNACPSITFFNNSAVDSINGDYIVSYNWDFGDGNTSSFSYETNTYAANGAYTVCLSITTNQGCTSTYCETVYVGCIGAGVSCQAWFYQDSLAPCPTVNLINGAFATAGILSYSYDFGDGTTSTDPNPSHTYTANGAYLACLTITAADSCVSSYCETVVVNCISGLEEGALANGYVSPNPAQNLLTLHLAQAQDIHFRILGMNGAIHAEGVRPAQIDHVFELDGLSQGMYLLEIQAQGSKEVLRFIRE